MATTTDPQPARESTNGPSVLVVVGSGACVSAILALTVSLQTQLSMRGHGHSIVRVLLWHFLSLMFWALAAPWVLRAGAYLAASGRFTAARVGRLASVGAALIALHIVVSAALTTWIQPYTPIVSSNFIEALADEVLPKFIVDLLICFVLLVGGGAFSAHRRAQRVELRESRLEARLDPREFLRVHRAAIVNVDEVREVQDAGALALRLSDGAAVPVSRSRRSAVESAVMPRLRPR